jgi:hypothetical protein
LEEEIMWRSFFLAVGITLFMFGLQGMALEKVVLKLKDDPPPRTSRNDTTPQIPPNIEINPAPWLPYSLLSTGTVVCLYSFTLPKRFGK